MLKNKRPEEFCKEMAKEFMQRQMEMADKQRCGTGLNPYAIGKKKVNDKPLICCNEFKRYLTKSWISHNPYGWFFWWENIAVGPIYYCPFCGKKLSEKDS